MSDYWCPFHNRLTSPMHVCWRIYEPPAPFGGAAEPTTSQ